MTRDPLNLEQRRRLGDMPLDIIDDGSGFACWAAGIRPDGLPGVYSLARDGGRLPVWAGLRPATLREAVAMAGSLNRRVAIAMGVRR